MEAGRSALCCLLAARTSFWAMLAVNTWRMADGGRVTFFTRLGRSDVITLRKLHSVDTIAALPTPSNPAAAGRQHQSGCRSRRCSLAAGPRRPSRHHLAGLQHAAPARSTGAPRSWCTAASAPGCRARRSELVLLPQAAGGGGRLRAAQALPVLRHQHQDKATHQRRHNRSRRPRKDHPDRSHHQGRRGGRRAQYACLRAAAGSAAGAGGGACWAHSQHIIAAAELKPPPLSAGPRGGLLGRKQDGRL
jgi:hypothetical protein